ncbi:MAG TPA: patatin-like phospholipase family protein [Xanthobacteraceae bacterium]|nr:patatin-like phospholipase family protein [Xanthobacteraceae bacterium]
MTARGAPRRRAKPPRKTLALALGAGGARGLAHIVVLEALDELGIRPAVIAGTSIGAVIGAAYAAGLSAKAIRRSVIDIAHNRGEVWRRLLAARAAALSAFLTAPFGNPMLIDAEKFGSFFLPDAVPDDFAKLAIPLLVVATELSGCREVVFSQGALRPAIAASMAIPGLVRPLEIDGHVLVDGGAVDPLPFRHLAGRADIVLAVDCSGGPTPPGQVPDPWEAVFATITVMGQVLIAEKLKHGAPDLIIRPNVGIFRMLDFFQASAILRAADPVKAEVKEKLADLLAHA